MNTPRTPRTPLRVAVTGGTSGLGLALVEAFAARGDAVAFVARHADAVARVARRHRRQPRHRRRRRQEGRRARHRAAGRRPRSAASTS